MNDQIEIDAMFAEQDELKRIEADYYENEEPRVMKSIQEWILEFPIRDRREIRRRYLQEQIEQRAEVYKKTGEGAEALEQLIWEGKAHRGQIEGVTSTMIERAQNSPIEKLIKHRNFMALCPFHKEKTPSLNLRKNFYFCHGCGASGNSITFLMKTQGVSFRKAVELLQ